MPDAWEVKACAIIPRRTALKIWTAALAGSLVALGTLSAHQAHAQAAPFLDTPTNHWAYEAVQNLAAKKIIIGYPDGTYGGRRPMTRRCTGITKEL